MHGRIKQKLFTMLYTHLAVVKINYSYRGNYILLIFVCNGDSYELLCTNDTEGFEMNVCPAFNAGKYLDTKVLFMMTQPFD